MKRSAVKLIFIIIFAMLVFCKTASADTYVVKKGDTLWKIAYGKWGTGKLWTEIARVNGISNPKKLLIGKELEVPVIDQVIKIVNHNTSPYGAKGVKSDEKVLQAIDKTSYHSEIKEVLKKVVRENNPLPYILMRGEKVEYFSDKKGVYHNPKGYEFSWRKIVVPAYVWTVEINEQKCEVFVIDGCGNFAARCQTITTPSKEREEEKKVFEAPDLKISEKKEELEKSTETSKPETYIVQVQEKIRDEKKMALEHEPIVGAWYWTNELAQGRGIYAEYMAWLREEYSWGYTEGWSPGVGMYGIYSQGNSKLSSYEWQEKAIGPQIGLKYISITDEGKPWQWQGKVRLLWEKMEGSNPESGYRMSQDNLKAGFYTEIIKQQNDPKWIIGATAEGWHALDRQITSTWSGDRPGNRNQLAINALVQYKVDDNIALKATAGPFYQGWDRLWGVNITAEARLWETVMIGPYVSFYPFGLSDIYNGVAKAGDLATFGGFVRIELGNSIRKLDKKVRMERVKIHESFDKMDNSDSINIQAREQEPLQLEMPEKNPGVYIN